MYYTNTGSRRGLPTPVTASTPPVAVIDPVYTSLLPKTTLGLNLTVTTLDPRRVLLLLIFGGLDVTWVDVVVRVCCACVFCAPVPVGVDSTGGMFHLHARSYLLPW